jgi:hypothetical protein
MKKYKLVSRTEKIIKKLKKEGKVSECKFPSKESEIAFYESCKKIAEDSKRKQNASWNSAKDVWLD